MNDDVIQDLKQFITATMHQEFSGVKDDISDLKDDMKSVKNEIRETREILSSRIDDIDAKLDTVIEASGEQLVDHETRITKLETKAA